MKNKLLFTRSLGLKLTTILFVLLLLSMESRGQIIISQVYEGASNNKWIEITNVGSTSVDLASPTQYKIGIWTISGSAGNGAISGNPTNSISLIGTLTPGAIYLLKNTSSSTTVPHNPMPTANNSNATVCAFNGNDALAIFTGTNTIVDAFGVGINNLDISYHRNSIILNTNSTFTSSEWTSKTLAEVAASTNTLTEYIGTHVYGAIAPTTQAHDITFSSVTPSGMKIDWTNGNGTSRAVFVKEATGAITNPVDGTTYAASTDWSSKGTQLGTSGYYCVYNSTGTTVTLTSLVAGTAYYVQAFEYNGSGATSKYYTATATGNPNNQTTAAAETPTLSVGALTGFGSQCINNTYGPNMFTISGTSLTAANVTVGALSGYTYSTTSGGGYTSSLDLTQPGGTYSQDIYVKFSPTAAQSYDGNIAVGGGGASSVNRSVTGSGVNTAPTVTTPTSASPTATTATLGGSITVVGCANVTERGIYWSTTNGFADGAGTKVSETSGPYSTGVYTLPVSDLPQGSTVYFKAFATSTVGTAYTTQASFATIKAEPTNHITLFEATTGTPTYSAIIVSWTDATGAVLPDGYLIKGSSVAYSSISDPIDGTAEADGGLVKNIAQGAGIHQLTGLTPNTPYYFKIYPYTNSGTSINYKTDPTIPQATASTDDFVASLPFSFGGTWNSLNPTAGITRTNVDTYTTNAEAKLSTTGNNIIVKYNAVASALFFDYKGYNAWTGNNVKVYESIDGTTWGTELLDITSATASYQTARVNLNSTSRYIKIEFTKVAQNVGIDNIVIGNPYTVSGTQNWTAVASNFNAASDITVSGELTVSDLGECNNFTIASTGKTTVSPSTGLIVNGDFLIQSDATGTGSFIGESADLLITGSTTVQRYLTKYNAGTDGMFHLLSSPVSAQAIATEFSNPAGNSTDDFYKYDETAATIKWINHRDVAGTGINSSFGETDFTVGRGYLVSYVADATKTFTGTLNTGTLATGTGLPALTYTSSATYAGWNLLGNPYASAIDWDNVASGQYANLDNAVYVYDNASSTYKTYVDGSGSLTGGIIPSMQGFFVHANAASPTLYLENQDRVHSTTGFYKSSTSENTIRLKVSGNERYDETFIRFNDVASTAFDGQLDAYKMYGGSSVPTFYSVAGSDKLSINSLPMSSLEGSVPLAVEAGANATYTLNLVENTLPVATYVTLEDKKTGTLQRLNDNPVYAFIAAPGEEPNRFVLHFKDATSVPDPTAKESFTVTQSNGNLNIVTPQAANAEIRVTNMLGQVVLRGKTNGNTLTSLNVNQLQNGVYVVSLVSGSKVVSTRIVVSR